MEPIGTITCYFSFIDDDTRTILEEHMEAASDYYDFVEKLGESVLTTDSPVMVVYFAVLHALLAHEFKLVDSIREKYEEHQILGPNLYFASVYQGTVEDTKKVHELADAVLETHPEDWIALEMNLMKFEVDMSTYPATIYQSSTMERIRELIESNPSFGFYEIILNDHLSLRAHADGDHDERMRCIDRGIQISEKFDDKVRMAFFMIRKASIIKDHDREGSRVLLEKAYHIVESFLGVPFGFANIIYFLSILNAIRGEYSAAISRCLKVVTLRERAGLDTGNVSLFLSTMYNVIGDPESGLEWAQMAESQYTGMPHVINRAILNQIWSLILLNRLTEANVLIDTSRESILKSGDERQLAWLHFVSGVLELVQGDTSLASSSIEQALRIYEQQGWALQIQLIFLHHLAKTEVYACTPTEAVAPSLAILEDKAISEDLPGILGQVLLLKADICIMNDDEACLRDIILQLRTLSERESLQFLKPYYDSLLRRL